MRAKRRAWVISVSPVLGGWLGMCFYDLGSVAVDVNGEDWNSSNETLVFNKLQAISSHWIDFHIREICLWPEIHSQCSFNEKKSDLG